jgi:hypothetical protein
MGKFYSIAEVVGPICVVTASSSVSFKPVTVETIGIFGVFNLIFVTACSKLQQLVPSCQSEKHD